MRAWTGVLVLAGVGLAGRFRAKVRKRMAGAFAYPFCRGDDGVTLPRGVALPRAIGRVASTRGAGRTRRFFLAAICAAVEASARTGAQEDAVTRAEGGGVVLLTAHRSAGT